MQSHSMTRAVFAGFFGTLAMVVLGSISTRFGFPVLDWAKALSSTFSGNVLLGYLLLFASGIALSLLYVNLFHDRLPGHSWRRGLLFAVIIWVVTGAAFAPILNMGFFMGSALVAVGTLMTYIAYGAIMGFIYDA